MMQSSSKSFTDAESQTDVSDEMSLIQTMKYENFKKRIATLLEEANAGTSVDFRDGTKLLQLLERDLLGTVKLCNQVSSQ